MSVLRNSPSSSPSWPLTAQRRVRVVWETKASEGRMMDWRMLAGSSGGHLGPWKGGRTPLLSGHVVCVHTLSDVQESRFLQQGSSDKDVQALLFSTNCQSASLPQASPLLPLLQNKRSVQGMPKCNWIKMKEKPSSFLLLLLGCRKGHAPHAKKLLISHSAGEGDLKPTKIIVTVFSQSQ